MIDRVRLLLVDDHEIVRRGLKAVLEGCGDFEVVGEAGTMKQGIAEALRLKPEVTVMDLRLPDGSGVEACRRIRTEDPERRIVILTSYADEGALYDAVMAGASGYILKDLDAGKLCESLLSVARGGSLLDAKMMTSVLDRLRGGIENDEGNQFAELSPQENRVLTLIGDGLSNREIAERLSLSEKTVKNYASQIYTKLRVERRSQAARLATERRIHREQG